MTFLLKLLLSLWLTTLSSPPSPGPADWSVLGSAMANQLREAGTPEGAAVIVAQLELALAQGLGLVSAGPTGPTDPTEACL